MTRPSKACRCSFARFIRGSRLSRNRPGPAGAGGGGAATTRRAGASPRRLGGIPAHVVRRRFPATGPAPPPPPPPTPAPPPAVLPPTPLAHQSSPPHAHAAP